MPVKGKPIFHGGLMWCCIESLGRYLEAGGSENVGTVVSCDYCKSSMIVKSDGFGYLMPVKLCKYCGQPMKPKGVKKKPNEYDHAQGCPLEKKR